MKLMITICLLAILAGCMQSYSDADLRGVPVTNNPNILPGLGQPSGGAPF